MSRNALITEDYATIKAHLQNFRLDSYIQQIESKKGKNKGAIFPFARGLRFSALLIYKIRKILTGTHLTADWGQILIDEDGTLSNECDIIIHKNGYVSCWNGEGGNGHIMDFKFIELEDVCAVISCKSYIKTNTIEIDYFKSLSRYVDKIWLFSECCSRKSITTIKRKAREIGYENFWYLYAFEKKTGITEDAAGEWHDFYSKIKSLVKPT